MQVSGLSGYTVSYRVYTGGRWLPWVKGLEDYAGIFGQAIEAIQVEIVSGSSGGGGGEIVPPVPGGRKVFIDPGHGGSDPGASGNGMNEKDIVLEISKKVGNILTQNGITVEYSRESDTYVSLDGRAQMANNWGASLFVSIHANSFGDTSARGTECFTYPTTDSQNKQLSANVARAISSRLGLINRGHKEDDFAVLRLTNMPAILVETAFISNPSDANILKNRKDDFAVAIANEILKYLGEGTPPITPISPIELIKHLTDVAIEFEKKVAPNSPYKYHYNSYVLDYLRHVNYNDKRWNFILHKPGDFIDYVNNNYSSLKSAIRPYITDKVSIIHNNIVDLPHFAATLMVYKGLGIITPAVPRAWGGWARDLATGMSEISQLKLTMYENETEQNIADKYVIANTNSSISVTDIDADIDVCGIYTNLFTDRIDILLSNYFRTVTLSKRKGLFLDDIGLAAGATLDEIGDKLYKYMNGVNGFLFPVAGKLLLELAMYDGRLSDKVIKAACTSLGKYISRL